ncbi:sequence-specific DNA binding transcription factor, partial [Perilla frutescens var. frutescens]
MVRIKQAANRPSARKPRGKNENNANKMGRVNKRIGGSNNVDVFPQLKSRACPGELVDAMGYMNEKQKDAVRTMGFAQILHLTTHKVPAQLAYWVLDHFDASSSEL